HRGVRRRAARLASVEPYEGAMHADDVVGGEPMVAWDSEAGAAGFGSGVEQGVEGVCDKGGAGDQRSAHRLFAAEVRDGGGRAAREVGAPSRAAENGAAVAHWVP